MIWDLLDTNGDGEVSVAELQDFVQRSKAKLGVDAAKKLESILKGADANNGDFSAF